MERLRDAHITYDDFLLALRGELPLGALLQKVHAHVLARCSSCRTWWDGDDPFPFGGAEAGDSEDATSSEDVEHSIEVLAISRKLYREARMDFDSLLKIPCEDWVAKVENARTRYRTRAFAQRLIREAKERVKDNPELARDIAALVPVSLRWATKKDRPWAHALVLLSDALRANALRISGELVEARRLFARLALEPIPAGEGKTKVEIDCLHASLYIAEGQPEEADCLLAKVEAWHREEGDHQKVAKVTIMRGNLAESIGEAQRCYEEHSKAAGLLDADEAPYLYLTTITGRVLGLTELDRLRDAAHLLDRHHESYEEIAGRFGVGIWTCLYGRLRLREEDQGEAIRLLKEGREILLSLNRNLDAAFASLDLATAYMAAGEIEEVRKLASELVHVFEAMEIGGKVLSSLRLLAEAEKIKASHLALVSELRQSLKTLAMVT